MKKRFLAALVIVLTALGITVAITPAAYAHAQWGCVHGNACFFYDVNGGPAGASHLTLSWSVWGDGQCHDFPTTWFNTASSMVSDYGNGYDIIIYENAGCSDFGDRIVSPRHLNFTGFWAFVNDDLQSFKIQQ